MEEKTIYRCSVSELKEKEENLKQIIEIFDSKLSDYEKLIQILKIYNTPKNFDSSYTYILKYGSDDTRFKGYLEKIREISKKLHEYENNGVYDNVKYILRMESYYIFYDYAKFIIEKYVNTESYITHKFLSSLGIDKSVLDYCLEIIKELNVDLYKEYLSKKEENKLKRYEANVYAFKNIANGIKTGYTFDKKEFDLFAFWKLVPFKYSEGLVHDFNDFIEINPNISFSPAKNFENRVKAFLKGAIPEITDVIIDYMRKNHISNYHYINETQLKQMYAGSKVIVNGKEIDIKDELDVILKYSYINKIPLLAETMKLIQQMYRTGKISKEQVDEEYKKLSYGCLIIPKLTKKL